MSRQPNLISYSNRNIVNTTNPTLVKNTMTNSTQNAHLNDVTHNAQDTQQVPRSLRQSVEESLTQYFSELDGQQTTALYELFMHQVEAPLFECVMQHTHDNQSKAAAVLGLNRGTLRKKLKQYDLL